MSSGWLYNPAGWSVGYAPSPTDFQNIAADIQAGGGNRDSNRYGLPNTAWLTLVPGDYPGTEYTVSAASWTGGTVTLTVTASHNIQVGQRFSLAGMNPSAYDISDAIATTGTTGTTLKYALASNPGTFIGAGSNGVVVDELSSPGFGTLAVNASNQLGIYGSNGFVLVGGSPLSLPFSAVTLANGANNNVNVAGMSAIYVNGPTGAFSITGLAGAVPGQVLEILYAGTQTLTVSYSSGSSSAGNKIFNFTGADLVLTTTSEQFTYVRLIYVAGTGVTNNLWQVLSHS